jgi:uncharacterized protein YkwD
MVHESANSEDFGTRLKRYASEFLSYTAKNISYNPVTEEEAMKR